MSSGRLAFTESVVEEAALEWLAARGWTILHGPEIVRRVPGAERTDPDFRDVVLERRLRQPFSRAGQAAKESRTLAALRDTLLPKLISGELRIGKAVRLVENSL